MYGGIRRVRFADEVGPSLSSSSSSDSKTVQKYKLEQHYRYHYQNQAMMGCYSTNAMVDAKEATSCTAPDITTMLVGLSLSEKSARWWSDKDIERTCIIAMKAAKFYCERRRPYITSYLTLYDKVHDMSNGTNLDRELTSIASILAKASVRGLEPFIFPTTYQSRGGFVKHLLETQSHFPPNVDPAVKQRMLSAKSVYMSQHARKFARLFGEGDAAVAEQIYREDLQQKAACPRRRGDASKQDSVVSLKKTSERDTRSINDKETD
eukprot:CAMPEP_0198112920 /NCGR_PEP_ID=MMETSP1442-20131203/4690_1 /TAXON_ID= /ORGANISM="Craspedostauros australis, Strain CCMP3328" /LENGTH=264 /DNA_ID=CAMNT_0043769853 /DNA_START=441 /DNA_END=1236 /DNA_ORIENTATION=-